ncbi:MAG: RNA chaperone Hfq [Clostridiaceae bacterium]|jgi:host factor-I protein|nr:RNA chaperone Hfq [Bacillota bacterium]NLN51342.1 RNA chaperone Hfq [Clostridiaceae bacterium]
MKKEKSLITSGRRMQDSFLNYCRKEEIPVILEMSNSFSAEGYIVGFDQDSIILDLDGAQQLYFLSALCCIKPKQEVNYIFNEAYRYKKVLKRYPEYTANYS